MAAVATWPYHGLLSSGEPWQGLSCGLQSVKLEHVVISGCGEEQLIVGGAVVTGAIQTQCPLKVQKLPHEVEVW